MDASCIPKGPDLAPQKSSVWGGAANRGFLPFYPRQLSHRQGRPDFDCLEETSQDMPA